MDVFSVLNMLGGLALFLFGMSTMGDRLEKASSGRLEGMLDKLAGSRFKAVALGAVVTAVMQSSSATTVTVVGFVNSGVMKLGQAIPIIMGANIGTTITSWILSLAGIESDSLLVQLLRPSTFSPILAAVGSGFLMFSRSEKKKTVGGIFLGFAVMMFGMQTMSEAMAPLAADPSFQNILTMFDNPILGVATGALLTGVIQSSAASVGILQMLAITGSITWSAAIPIIMGQNIGTCVTALMSCIGANKNARRTAMVHLYFNLLGTLVFLAAFLIVRATGRMAFLSLPINAAGIAIAHSVFNLGSTALLLPFSGVLEKLACLTIPDRPDKEDKVVLLDDRLLAAPVFAINRCKELTLAMAREASEALLKSISLMENYSRDAAREIVESEDRVDRYEDNLGTFLVKLSANSLSTVESKEVSKILHGIGDLERISDHAVNIMEVAEELEKKQLRFSDDARAELEVVTGAVKEVLDLAVRSFQMDDVPLAKWVEPLEEVIDDIIRDLKLRHVERLRAGRCTVEMGFIFNDLLSNYERVADHCSNLAICVIELDQGEYNAHEYALKTGADSSFAVLYDASKRKYALPQSQAQADEEKEEQPF